MRGRLLIRKLHRRLGREEGFSMMEVVLLLVILAIALVPLTRLATSNLKFGAQYSMMTRAMGYAQEAMEEIIADYRAESAGRGYDWVRSNWDGATASPATGYTRSVDISSEMTLNGVTYVNVTVSVSHADISNVTLETILVE